MAPDNSTNNNSFSSNIRSQQIAIMTQLLKAMTAMHGIDELFQWLCYTLVQRFNLELVQFWTPMVKVTGAISVRPRVMVARDPSLPGSVVLNNHIRAVTRRIAYNQQSALPSQYVDNIFSTHQAMLLKRYGLNYCIGGFINSNALLPPPHAVAHKGEPALFSLTYLLFLSQPAHSDLALTINVILKQAAELALNRGFLLRVPASRTSSTPYSPVREELLSSVREPHISPLAKVIPHRKENSDMMQSNSLFARSAGIADERVFRLFSAIDGHLNVAELCQKTEMSMSTIVAILKMLLYLKRVDLYDAQGNYINPSTAFKEE